MRIPRVRFLFFNIGEMGPTAPPPRAAWNIPYSVLGPRFQAYIPTPNPQLFIPFLVPKKHLYLLCINKYIIYGCACVCVRACELPRLQVCCGIQNRFWGFESDFLAVPFLTCHFFCCCLSPSGCWKQPLPFLLSFLKSVSLRPLPTCLLSQWP